MTKKLFETRRRFYDVSSATTRICRESRSRSSEGLLFVYVIFKRRSWQFLTWAVEELISDTTDVSLITIKYLKDASLLPITPDTGKQEDMYEKYLEKNDSYLKGVYFY